MDSSECPPRVLFMGTQSDFSYPSLRALLAGGIEICAVVIPALQHLNANSPAIRQREQPPLARSMLPLLHSSVLQLARERRIPVWEVHRLSDPEAVSVLSAYQPDMISVACFPQRIPRSILDLPRFSCLNVHPSLLPANRGPVPLFWTFREGCDQTGVTIHMMDEALDSGAILAQESIEAPDGISYVQLESRCARRGGELLTQTVWNLYRGHAVPVPQDETKSSYHPFPVAEDFIVPVKEWSARHVYNFISGVTDWGESVKLFIDGKYFVVGAVLSYSHKNTKDAPSGSDGEVWVHCKVGWVKIALQGSSFSDHDESSYNQL